MDDNCGEWVECIGVASGRVESMNVVSRRWMWVGSMGVASGCGCKEVYRFPHITYPYTPLVYVLFCSSIPTICSFFKCFIPIQMTH